ncbi:hypothetical protein [Kutzneria sp. 744]|uniref:methyltransferase family protein n=1 Tax=Kutzneria sp. (strain 744) TaxID=345341 RepID=UPI001E525C5D|nr:hypothetical protein [Kutzneria sp. 744]
MGQPSIMSLADLATPMAIRVAATLNLVDRAGDGATAERLAADTGTSAPILRRLLDHLVTVGLFTCESDRYRPTDLGAQLAEFKPLLDINRAGGRADLAFVDLLHTITTGASAYTHRYGREFWADLDAHPPLRRSFDAQMAWRFENHVSLIAANFPLGAVTLKKSTPAVATATCCAPSSPRIPASAAPWSTLLPPPPPPWPASPPPA